MKERIRVVVVEHFPAMGKRVAMEFLKWAQNHPGGVISLPTGKTPEHFIKWVARLTGTWNSPETQALLAEGGVDSSRPPDMRSLRFVQIDEFYPIDPAQHNSFHYYVNEFYIRGFGLDPARALLMDTSRIGLIPGQTLESVWPDGQVDLSLRHRAPRTALEEVQKRTIERIDQWCQEYESRIRAMGGIGFFLGGIGPDGHIAFNVRGSDHYSTTRLTATNYETQAAAAVDLGGVEISRRRLVITIGLGTITANPDCTAVIVAAGEAKAGVVADAIQREPDVLYPATVLQRLPNAFFCITGGAGKLLEERQTALMTQTAELTTEQIDKVLIDGSIRRKRRLRELTGADLAGDAAGAVLLAKVGEGAVPALAAQAHDRMEQAIERGLKAASDTRFLHTEPHHDDLMLGYLPAIVRNVRPASNAHHFCTLTSGFTAVTNGYLLSRLGQMRRLLNSPDFVQLAGEGYFRPDNAGGRDRDLWQFLDGLAGGDAAVHDEGAARRLFRNLVELFGVDDPGEIDRRAAEMTGYLRDAYPGQKDPAHIQKLKGMIREWEAECLWGYFGFRTRDVSHLRLGFYTGDIFTQEPTADRDVPPILERLDRFKPDVLSVALDPEGSGPDTHYKVMQAIRAALEARRTGGGWKAPRIWGYRNVWYRFHASEANLYVPVTLNMFSIMDSAFMNTFMSQRDASFPSHEHDGPFCELARKIQVEQYQAVKTCLGREWFHDHPSPLVRATRGLVFLRDMELSEFLRHSRELRRAAEDRE